MRIAMILVLTVVACFPRAALALQAELLNVSTQKLDNPQDMTLSPDGALLYVADAGNGRIAVLDAITLDVVGEIGTGRLEQPSDVDVSDDGRELLVADTGNDRIAVFKVDGKRGIMDRWIDTAGKPVGVARHPTGLLLVAAARTGDLAAFDERKRLWSRFQTVGAQDIVIDEDEHIWISDPVSNQLAELSPAGEQLRSVQGAELGLKSPDYISLPETGGALWVTDREARTVTAIDTKTNEVIGTIDGKPSAAGSAENSAGLQSPLGVTAYKDMLWVSDTAGDRIHRYRISN